MISSDQEKKVGVCCSRDKNKQEITEQGIKWETSGKIKLGRPRKTLKRKLTREAKMVDIKSLDETDKIVDNRDSRGDTASPV